MKTFILALTSIIFLTLLCCKKEPQSVFSQVIDYCELKESHNAPYCELGLHQKTLEEIKAIYEIPMDSDEMRLLTLDTCAYENGAWTLKTLAFLCSKFKGKETPDIFCYTWDLGYDSCFNENIWLRIYFVDDEFKQYRSIYGEIARKSYFFLE